MGLHLQCPCNRSSMTLLSRSATRTHIKPQMTYEPFRRTSALNMKLINSCLTVLVFINAVHSAAMREGSEDLLYFLKDAFEMNLPLDHTEPTPLSEMDLATKKILDPVHLADPTADQADKPHDTDKRAVDLDSPEFEDTSERPDRDADSEERDGGRGTSQIQTSGIKLKLSYADKQDILDDSRESVDYLLGCTETSAEHPMEENNSLDAPNLDQKIQTDTKSYQNQLRKICPTKRERESNNSRARLDLGISKEFH
ncbi:uncharacterized protein LOC132103513 [Carassius carassius]|uniref:uncharacterized protein LOC132103513 n=1 Tax=Carassius carassius TaxID=217509 RepID=UPI002868DE3F|nr:uncharacterized protein LOC132103513 [Carassius carassius]